LKPAETAQRCLHRAHKTSSVCELWYQYVANIPEPFEHNAERPWVLVDLDLSLQILPTTAWCYPSLSYFLVKMFLLGDSVHILTREIGELWHNFGAEENVHMNCWWNQEADKSTWARFKCEKLGSDKLIKANTHSDSLIFQILLDMWSGSTLSHSQRWIACRQWDTTPRADASERRDADMLALLHMLNIASRLRLQQKELWLFKTVVMAESQKQTNSR
jgi:hypothetical protein